MTVEQPQVKATVQPANDDAKKKVVKKDELSEEDLKMKEEIDGMVEQLKYSSSAQYVNVLSSLKAMIQTATSSMTSVPRPLKFLRPHFRDLQLLHTTWTSQHPTPKTTSLLANIDNKGDMMDTTIATSTNVDASTAEHLSDVLSVLGMTFDSETEHPCLRYCIQGTDANLSLWGHEYLRHLSAEMLSVAAFSDETPVDPTAPATTTTSATAAAAVTEEEESIYFTELETLAQRVAPQLCQHHAYMDAVDLAVFFELSEIIDWITDADTARKMAMYLTACAQQLLGEEQHFACHIACCFYLKASDLVSAFGIYLTFDYPTELRFLWEKSLLLSKIVIVETNNDSMNQVTTGNTNQQEMIRDYFEKHPFTQPISKITVYQMAFEMTRKYSGPAPFIISNTNSFASKMMEDQVLKRIFQNADQSKHYLSFAKELEILDPKHPDDIYKSHLEHMPKYASSSNLMSDSKHALASSFVNAFLNAGFLSDKLLNDEFIYKHRDLSLVSVCASAGLIRRWDMDSLADLDRYIASDDPFIRAGGLLGVGLISCGCQNDFDAALYLLTPFLEHSIAADCTSYPQDAQLLIGTASMALSLAYMGTCRFDLLDKLMEPLLNPTLLSMETKGLLVLSIGMIFAGFESWYPCNDQVTSVLLDLLHGLSQEEAQSPYAKWMALGLALTFLGQGEGFTGAIQEALRVLPGDLSEIALLMTNACAFSASGDVEEVRMMIEKIMECEKSKKEMNADGELMPSEVISSYAIIAMAMMALREDVGKEMVMRLYRHLMAEGDRGVRRAIPLGIALLYVSHPTNTGILDLLSRYTHDADKSVAQHAIFALGLVGAGTNNARIAQMLRQLVAYYHKDASILFVLRLAQGLLHLGKGMLTCSPFHSSDRLNWNALSGILIVIFGMLDASGQFLVKHHSMIYYLVAAMYPRSFVTLDESLNPMAISVRVGQAVDTIGQAGQRKTITGWQTHLSPVLINVGERAEMATEEFLPQSSVLEGFVICQKNPDYVAPR